MAEMGLNPTDFSRFCNHSGLGPLRKPRITRPAKIGQADAALSGKSIDTLMGLGNFPGGGSIACIRNVPMPAAARSRAIPYTEVQSPRLGVIATSSTASLRP